MFSLILNFGQLNKTKVSQNYKADRFTSMISEVKGEVYCLTDLQIGLLTTWILIASDKVFSIARLL